MKKLILPIIFFLSGHLYAQDVFTYLADFKEVAFYGFADSAGNTKTPGKYNLIAKPAEGLSRVWAGQKSANDYASIRYGFCLPNGTELIAPQFTKAEDFSEGMAVVATGDAYSGYRYGFVNKKGIVQIPMTYKYAKSFSQGLAPVATEEKKWMFIDKTGALKIAGPFLDADQFSEGLAGVSVPHDLGGGVMSFKKGYIDPNGKMVIQPAYNYVMPFKNGVAVVSISESSPSGYKSYQALIDKSGKRLTTQEFVTIYHTPSEGLYAVKISGSSGLNNEKDVWGVIDSKGVLQGARFTGQQPYFSEGLATFMQDGKIGYMDKAGNKVVPPVYKNALSFSEGLAAVLPGNGLWGYINKKGETVIKAEYIAAGRFSDGVAVVSTGKSAYDKDRLTGVIDKSGKVMIPFQKIAIGDFKNGRAMAESNYISYYIYKNGKTSLACDVSTLANGRYAFQALARNDVNSAVKMFRDESSKNCPLIDYWLGYILLQAPPPNKDTVSGAKLVEKAAKAGYPEAMYSAGFMYLNGLAVTKDEAAAKQWLLKAAKAGVPTAYTLLGTAEDKTNPAQAANYYQQAVDLNEPVAMYYLALLYRDGRGVAKSNVESNDLLVRSSKLNYAPAKQLLTANGK